MQGYWEWVFLDSHIKFDLFFPLLHFLAKDKVFQLAMYILLLTVTLATLSPGGKFK